MRALTVLRYSLRCAPVSLILLGVAPLVDSYLLALHSTSESFNHSLTGFMPIPITSYSVFNDTSDQLISGGGPWTCSKSIGGQDCYAVPDQFVFPRASPFLGFAGALWASLKVEGAQPGALVPFEFLYDACSVADETHALTSYVGLNPKTFNDVPWSCPTFQRFVHSDIAPTDDDGLLLIGLNTTWAGDNKITAYVGSVSLYLPSPFAFANTTGPTLSSTLRVLASSRTASSTSFGTSTTSAVSLLPISPSSSLVTPILVPITLATLSATSVSNASTVPGPPIPSSAISSAPSEQIDIGIVTGATLGMIAGLALLLFAWWYWSRRRARVQKGASFGRFEDPVDPYVFDEDSHRINDLPPSGLMATHRRRVMATQIPTNYVAGYGRNRLEDAPATLLPTRMEQTPTPPLTGLQRKLQEGGYRLDLRPGEKLSI